MTKAELRKARKAARPDGKPLTGDLAIPRQDNREDRQIFTESRRGYRARQVDP